MANQQLVDYIKAQLAAGVLKPDLEKAITQAGWSSQESVDAFSVVEGRVPVAPAAPSAAPTGPTRPVESVRPTIPSVAQATPYVSRTWLWVLIAVVTLTVLIGGLGYYFRAPIQEIYNFYTGGGQAVLEELQKTPGTTQTFTGTYVYAGTTTPAYLLVTPESDTNATTTSHYILDDASRDTAQEVLVGSTVLKGEGCTIAVDTTLELGSIIAVEQQQDVDRTDYQATFVGPIRIGTAYDECMTEDGVVRTERP